MSVLGAGGSRNDTTLGKLVAVALLVIALTAPPVMAADEPAAADPALLALLEDLGLDLEEDAEGLADLCAVIDEAADEATDGSSLQDLLADPADGSPAHRLVEVTEDLTDAEREELLELMCALVPGEEEEPADEEPADEESADEEPADEEPADEEPADEEPADEESADEDGQERPSDEEPSVNESTADGADEDERPSIPDVPATEEPAENDEPAGGGDDRAVRAAGGDPTTVTEEQAPPDEPAPALRSGHSPPSPRLVEPSLEVGDELAMAEPPAVASSRYAGPEVAGPEVAGPEVAPPAEGAHEIDELAADVPPATLTVDDGRPAGGLDAFPVHYLAVMLIAYGALRRSAREALSP